MSRMILTLLVCLAGLKPLWSREPVVWVASPWQHVLRSVDAIVDNLVRSFTDWSQNPEAYMAARAKLAALITEE